MEQNNIAQSGGNRWLSLGGRLLPWVVAVVLFFGVSYTFYAPQFEGRSLAQGDIAQYAGMSQDVREHREATGEDPQWTGNMFSGMPAYLIDVEYPTQYVKRGASAIVKVVDSPMNMTFMAMLMMMVAVVLMGINPWIGIIAGLAYGLSTYFFLIIDAGHITKMWALVYAPPLVGAVWCALRRNLWLGTALSALFGSLELGANHPQITYYFLLVCLALWLSELVVAIRRGAVATLMRHTAVLAVAAVVAVGSNIAPLWYTMEHKRHTTRAESEVVDAETARSEKIAYNTAWSYGIAESCNMLVPNYMGSWSGDINNGAVEVLQRRSIDGKIFDMAVRDLAEMLNADGYKVTADDVYYAIEQDENLMRSVESLYYRHAEEVWGYASNYWGSQPYTAGPTYLGAVVIFLALLALMLYPWRSTLWVVAVTIFALLLAWGANVMGLYEILYDILPAYKSFRTVSMALVVVEWSVPLLAVCAIYRIVTQEIESKSLLRKVGIAYAVIVVAVVAMMLAADYGLADIYDRYGNELWVEQLRSAVYEGRRSALVADAWRTILFVTLSASALAGYALLRKKGNNRWYGVTMATALALLIVWDLSGVAKRYISDDKWHAQKPTEHIATKADKAILADKDLGFRVLDYSGDPFNSARASYFHRSVGGYHGAKLGRYQDVIDRYLRHSDGDVLAMLNTRYVIYDGEALRAEAFTGVEPMGSAWFVSRCVYAPSASDALERVGYEDLTECAIVEDVDLDEGYDNSGTIALVEYAPNYLRYEYDAPAEALAVFSEIYFPDGWSVTIDGKDADYFVANYILRGMELPAGKHTVEWHFRAPHWGLISVIMALCSIVVLLFVARAILMIVKSKN
ncbi:MAG: hypothetical protein J6V55_06925 [Alistipes sp.]|nr:hypothetical protein [Alistipes sp.]